MTFSISITEHGRSWSPTEIDALGVIWTDAPLDDLGEALRRAGYRVEVLWSVGLMLHATVDRLPVTGPDGDNPIRDEQIRELLNEANRKSDEALHRDQTPVDDFADWNIIVYHCSVALGIRRARRGGSRSAPRTRCAAAYNARHAVAPPTALHERLETVVVDDPDAGGRP